MIGHFLNDNQSRSFVNEPKHARNKDTVNSRFYDPGNSVPLEPRGVVRCGVRDAGRRAKRHTRTPSQIIPGCCGIVSRPTKALRPRTYPVTLKHGGDTSRRRYQGTFLQRRVFIFRDLIGSPVPDISCRADEVENSCTLAEQQAPMRWKSCDCGLELVT
uniref:Uncharacterized protein n=1 Tax=Timema poppense TaxID=170557 RepID=A0A7R9CS79_TIMPO|nr:unnamed protein product [Timema poppensis]